MQEESHQHSTAQDHLSLREQKVEAQFSQQLFHIAFSQRKKINLEKLKEHVTARSISYSQRMRIYLLLQNMFKQKIEYTKNFIKDFIKYFEDTLSLYGYFYKSMGKLDLNQKPKEHFIYETFQKAALQLTELNNGQIQNLKVLTHWIDKILLPALKAVLEMYKDQTKDQKKEIQSFQSDIQSAKGKQSKHYEKINENNDLLENQIYLIEKFDFTDDLLKKWGNSIFKNWNALLKSQGEIREQLQKNIIQFHDKFTKVYNESETSKNLLNFWQQMDPSPNWVKTFASVLNEKDCEFINFGCEKNSLKANFQKFIDFIHQKQRVGDSLKLTEILLNKKFKCKLQKTQREYTTIKIYFTVDKNVLLFDENKKRIVLKLKENTFKIRRLSQNMIEIKGTEVGTFFDSKRIQNIHFATMDEAEQFSFFVDNLLKQNLANH